jgi:spore germination protein
MIKKIKTVIKPVLDGIKTTSLAYTGPEIMLILLVFMEQRKKARRLSISNIPILIKEMIKKIKTVIGNIISNIRAIE